MVWIHAINEGPSTTRMNPVSDDKLRLLGRYMCLEPGQHILDIGSGRCGARDNPTHEDVDDVRRWRRDHAVGLAIPGRDWTIVAGRKTQYR